MEKALRKWAAGTIDKEWERALRTEHRLLLATGATFTMLVEDAETEDLLGLMIVAIVSHEFYEDCRTATEPYVMKRMIAWQRAGRMAALDAKTIERDNADKGLTLMITSFGIWPTHEVDRAQIYTLMLTKFGDEYDGYKLRRVFAEPMVPLFRTHMIGQGYEIVNSYPDCPWVRPEEGVPVLLAVDRETALAGHDFFLLRFFSYSPPVLGLTRHQKELMAEGCRGGTDKDIAERTGMTPVAIKRTWSRIYDRFEANRPGYLPEHEEGKKGKTERRRLAIAYVKEHLEELRPNAYRTV